MNPALENRNNVAIYCRLSIEDGDYLVSQSIQNQKDALTKYCLEKGFNIFNIYVDDGFSGTNFNRPGFNQMINDIECGLIDIVVTKDLSRLGRDYIETGRLIERYFPENNVRYIAVSDDVDTKSDKINDFIPFKNILNEFYAKDISRKIKTTLRYQEEAGIYKPTAMSLYGYMDNQNRTKRILNPDTAPTVKKIFELFINGYSLQGICDYLYENKILSPKAYNESLKGEIKRLNPYIWSPIIVANMLKNSEYLGHYIKGKLHYVFKTKKRIYTKKEDQHIFKNVFDPIISEETFNIAQTMFVKNRGNSGITNPYAGLAYCGICGKTLRIQRHKNGNGYYEERLVCRNTKEIGKGSILLSDLNEVIKNELLNLKELIIKNKDEFINIALKKKDSIDYKIPNNNYEAKILTVKRRIEDIDKYIKNLFEESVSQNLDNETYVKLMSEYELERNTLETEIKKLELLSKDNDNLPDEEKLNIFINKLGDIDEDNYNSNLIIRSIISKILITTFDDNKNKLGKKIIIYYKVCDDLIKDFMNGDENGKIKS